MHLPNGINQFTNEFCELVFLYLKSIKGENAPVNFMGFSKIITFYTTHYRLVVIYPFVVKHFFIKGFRLPSTLNLESGIELIHLPQRL